jgi:hypothetical protein
MWVGEARPCCTAMEGGNGDAPTGDGDDTRLPLTTFPPSPLEDAVGTVDALIGGGRRHHDRVFSRLVRVVLGLSEGVGVDTPYTISEEPSLYTPCRPGQRLR